jgi:hypothetical protein
MLDSLFERRRRGWRRRTREIARHTTRTRDANTRASFEAASLDGDGRRARRRSDARRDARNVLMIVVKRYYSSSQLSFKCNLMWWVRE